MFISWAVALASYIWACAPGASAQTGAASTAPPTATPPPASPAPALRGERPNEPPVLTRHPLNHRDWTVVINLRLIGCQPKLPGAAVDPLQTRRVSFDSATMFFPLTATSASHDNWDDRVTGKWEIDGRMLAPTPRLLTGYQSGTRLGAWDAAAANGNALQLSLEIPMTSFETRIDETRAVRIAWPTTPWPDDIASALMPQLMVESQSPQVRLLLERWMRQAPGGPEPRNTPPYSLAKYLAGRAAAHYQPQSNAVASTGRGQNSLRYSGALLSGFAVDGAAVAAERGRGPVLDMANLLVAVYRAAGIPARLVIGHDNRVQDDRVNEKQRATLVANVRAWAEFYLYDEHHNRGEWIPVDVQRQREFSSRPPPLAQRWQFFGHHEDLDYMQPLAFHWIPPTICMNIGPPALWGWLPKPESAVADPDLRVVVRAASRRGDDPKRATPGPGGAARPE
ncbi:MAG: transglutaminase-like domain-containing protein [Phycisphaerales bacterium]